MESTTLALGTHSYQGSLGCWAFYKKVAGLMIQAFSYHTMDPPKDDPDSMIVDLSLCLIN